MRHRPRNIFSEKANSRMRVVGDGMPWSEAGYMKRADTRALLSLTLSEFTRDWKSQTWWCMLVTLVFMKLWAEAGECQVGGQLGDMVSLSQNQTKSKDTRSSSQSGTTRGWRYHRSPWRRRRRMAEGG